MIRLADLALRVLEIEARKHWPALDDAAIRDAAGQAGEDPDDTDGKHARPGTHDSRANRGPSRETAASAAVGLGTARRAAGESPSADSVPGEVFLCHVREDAGEADLLQQVLERAGIGVWRDTERIQPGEDWRLKIRTVIATRSVAFLACFSERSCSKTASYQREELRFAIDQMRLRQPGVPWLIPVRFDPCYLPEFDLGAGRTLASLGSADLFGPDSDTQAERLVRAIRQLLADKPGSSTREASSDRDCTTTEDSD